MAGDTELFASDYVQSVLGKSKNVIIIGQNLIFFDWYSTKLFRQWPDLHWDGPRFHETRSIHVFPDFIVPNIDHYPIIFQKGFELPDGFQITFKKLGRILQRGQGIHFDDPSLATNPLRSSDQNIRDPFNQYNLFRQIYSEYAYFYLAKGLVAVKTDRPQEALTFFEKGIDIALFCIPCLTNFCQLRSHTGPSDLRCENLSEFKSQTYNYY